MSYKVIANKANKTAEIYLYEDIGEGWFGGTSAKQFADDLKSLGSVEEINLRINSPGGSVFEGNAIYNLIAAHKANVIVHIDGLAASIASVVAMAGNEIRMAANALMMIHDPWGMAIGTADEMRTQADTLDTVRATILGTYVRRTSSEEKAISDWMEAETWMDAGTAVERGFADVVAEELQMAASYDIKRYGYHNAPAALIAPRNKHPRMQAAGTRIASMQARLRKRGL